MNDVETFLEHYGIKGMKWGVRRERGSNGRVSTEAKRADDILKKAKTHGPKSLTNKELGDLNKRLQLEQQFNKLNVQKPGPSKAVANFIADVGKTQAKNAVNSYVSAQVKGMMENKPVASRMVTVDGKKKYKSVMNARKVADKDKKK